MAAGERALFVDLREWPATKIAAAECPFYGGDDWTAFGGGGGGGARRRRLVQGVGGAPAAMSRVILNSWR
jgi:hypothetical protein